METSKLKKFAQFARRSLMDQVSARLKLVLDKNSTAQRENADAISKLEEVIEIHGQAQIVERVAYIWFNRFCALRFMDVNRYTRISVVSPAEGQFQPEILAEAKMGHIDEELISEKVRQQIFALLDGQAPSRDPQSEAYRLLVVAACNSWNRAMPFLFQRIDDYTELLMPDDLLSGNSILAYTREAMTPDVCKDVEVIGWLYQFYISEKKDEVFAGLKKNKKITPENIPAATQLFTPHWIVRYLVENSLGRLWMLNRPQSRLFASMQERGEDCFYIEPIEPETDFLHINSPEEIKVCDPACGSGHMLTYAFDLLYAIYEEEGVDPAEVPEKILTHNLYGIEIDERAGELAAFALTMKAASKFKGAKQRRFFRQGIKPNICVLENISFDEEELQNYFDFVGYDLFTASLQATLHQFTEADNFGSLIRPAVTDVEDMLQTLHAKDVSGQLFLNETHVKVLQALRQVDYLSPKYHVAIANPPYLDKFDNRFRKFSNDEYKASKANTYSMFIERCLNLILPKGFASLVTLQGWMFNYSFEKLRYSLYDSSTIITMAHLGPRAFDSISGEVVSTVAFCINKSVISDFSSIFIDLTNGKNESEKALTLLEAIVNKNHSQRFRSSFFEFEKVPGCPLAYWAHHKLLSAFGRFDSLGQSVDPRSGMATGNNDRFLRNWSEVSQTKIGFNYKSRDEAQASNKYWFPYNKGGTFRKWYGNNEFLVLFHNDGYLIKKTKEENLKKGLITANNSKCWNQECYFLPCLTWSALSTSLSMRFCGHGFIFDTKGQSLFTENTSDLPFYNALLNSKVCSAFLQILTPTLDFNSGYLRKIPDCKDSILNKNPIKSIEAKSQHLSKVDWDSYETSWDFTNLPLLSPAYLEPTLEATFLRLCNHWREMTREMQQLEEENNRIFIEAYGLQEELTPEVPLNEITLTCNPHYRYGNDKSEEELEKLLQADTIRELVSYAVGCMFGRYALDKPGLILANQGETIDDYRQQVPESCFPADDDNVIPLLDGDWFTDDISERFRRFLRVAFGEEHYEENLAFVEQSLNVKGRQNYSIRDYFLGEFYNDHVKRYKKRPIYWLFSSPKGSFNALIYLHRFSTDTVSVVLNEYLRNFNIKLTSRKEHLEAVSISDGSSQSEKTKALKEIEKLSKMIAEIEEYDREVLYPLALSTRQEDIDLDEGVKYNYQLFGKALKKVTGLS